MSNVTWGLMGSVQPKLAGIYTFVADLIGSSNGYAQNWRIRVNDNVVASGVESAGGSEAKRYQVIENLELGTDDTVHFEMSLSYSYIGCSGIYLLAKYPNPSLSPLSTLGNIPIFRFPEHYGGGSNSFTYTSTPNSLLAKGRNLSIIYGRCRV